MTEIPSVSKMEQDAEPWVERLARLGYVAKGIVYIIVGGIALRVATGTSGGGGTTGTEGAIESIARQPLGRAMVALLAVGLLGYAIWRFVQAIRDPEGKGSDAKGKTARAAYGISGIVHAGLALEAARLALGSGQGDGSESGVDSRTAMLMSQPFGQWLVGLVGLVIAAFGCYELYRAYKGDVAKRLRLRGVDDDTRRWIVRSGRLGYAARGVVFLVIGYFLVQAARRFDPSDARGLGGALQSLRGESYGPWLLGLVAVGLVAYGVFSLVNARYRHIDPA